MLFTLLSVRWLTFRNTLFRAERKERGRARRALLFSAFVVCGLGVMAYGAFAPLAELALQNTTVHVMLSRLPAFGLFTAFWLLLLSAVTVGLQTLYLNQEMPLLLSLPVSPRSVFIAKFIEATITNALFFLTLGVPLFLAYGLARGLLSPEYLLRLFVTLIAFSALPTGLGVLAAILLMRVLPAGRLRDMLAACGITAFSVLYFVFSTSATRLQHASTEEIQQGAGRLLRLLESRSFKHSPWGWGGEILSGDYSAMETWGRLGLLWSAAVLAVAVCIWAAESLHYRGWSLGQEIGSLEGMRRRRREGERRRGGDRERSHVLPLRLLPPPIRAVMQKDFLSLLRDMRQLSYMLIPAVVIAYFLNNMRETDSLQQLPPTLFVQVLLFLLSPIALRMAMAAFVAENRAFWLMLTAPNDPTRILTGKFFYACTLSFPLAILATVGYGAILHIAAGQLLLCLLFVLCAMAGFCGIGVGVCAVFADLGGENPRYPLTSGGRLAIFGIQMGYLLLLALVTGGAWLLGHLVGISGALVIGGAGLLVVALSVGFVLLPLQAGARRLRQMEW